MQQAPHKKRRGANEGSIYKRADGRWTAAITLGYKNGKLQRKQFYGKTREDVSKKLIAALKNVQDDIPLPNEKLTVEQFLTHWLENVVKTSVRTGTFRGYEQITRTHLIPALGRFPIAKLAPLQVQQFLNERLKAGLSARTVQLIRTGLRRALGQALKWGYVARNVATLVDPPRVTRPEIKAMSPAEAKQFLEAIKGDRLEALFSVALAMGLRQGEALGLKWEDADFDSRTIRIRRSLQTVKGGLELSEVKTKNSRRDLPLVDSILAALKSHRTRQLEEKLHLGQNWQDLGFVFASEVGTAIYPRNVVRKFHSLLKAAKLGHYRFHDLRHSCASLLLAQGIPLKTVSDILGHSQISITADFYAHIFDEQKREAMSVFDYILAVK